jgi:rare lipoprotein A
MIFLGILWITSWVGSFLSFNQSLPPSFTSKVTATKVPSNLGQLVNKPLPFLMPSRQQKGVLSTTLPSMRFLRMDEKHEESKPKLTKPSNSSYQTAQNSRNQFCGSTQSPLVQQSKVKTASILSVPSLVEPSSSNRDFLPNQILRSLQNFFRVSNPVEESFGSASLPVVVVRRDKTNYEVWVNNRLVANVPDQQQASLMQQRLTTLIKSSNFDASRLRPALVDGIPALMAGNRFLFKIGQEVAQRVQRSNELLAIEWINNLRQAMQAPKLSLVEGQQQMYGLTPSNTKFSGLASWYGPYFHGRLTANGETFDQNELTVAHRSLPFNTYLQVTNLKSGKTVIVRVNDRGPYIPPRSLDLSRVAARCLDSEVAGVVPYQAVILKLNEPQMTLKGSPVVVNKQNKPPKKLAVISDL